MPIAQPAERIESSPAPRRRGRPPVTTPAQLLAHPLRLHILKTLSCSGAIAFIPLMRLVRTNYGNLSVHTRRLEVCGLLTSSKTFVDRRTRTEFQITAAGMAALREHTDGSRITETGR
jgi:hypothetical protein